MLNILYIHSAGPFGGSSRSLYEVLRALPSGETCAHFIVQRGTSNAFFSKISNNMIATRGITRFDNTRFGRYSGFRWLILLRELYHLPFTLHALWRARRKWPSIDIIHLNEIVEIIPGLLAQRLFKAPLVVHVRSVQNADKSSHRTRTIHKILSERAAAVVCIDETVRESIPGSVDAKIIHNAFEPEAKAVELELGIQAQLDKLRTDSLKVCFVGNLLVSKGVLDLVEAARIAKLAGADIEFVIVGGSTRESRGALATMLGLLGMKQNVSAEMRARIEKYGLGADFHFTGATPAIQRIFERVDVLTFPSHLDAPGRPIFEAAFFGVPSVVSIDAPKADTLIDGETGVAVPARDPASLAAAFVKLAGDRQNVRRMGENARALARRNFMPSKNATSLLELYKKVAAEHAREFKRGGHHV